MSAPTSSDRNDESAGNPLGAPGVEAKQKAEQQQQLGEDGSGQRHLLGEGGSGQRQLLGKDGHGQRKLLGEGGSGQQQTKP